MTLPVVFTANGSQGYNLTNSLRFRSSASAYLSRTASSTVTDNKKLTASYWVKRGRLSTYSTSQIIMYSSGGDRIWFDVQAADTLSYYTPASYANVTGLFRDPSAWYHIVMAIDTTQATAANRVKVYVNGVERSVTGAYPSLNQAIPLNTASQSLYIGSDGSGSYFDGYLAEVNFIDGQALTPSSFGATNAQTGVWQPAKYTGTYGTNGFYLPFTDNSALTTSSNAGLGKDFSGNGNYWTTNNISITSGSTYDSMTDVPTLTSATQANYCVVNPLDSDSTVTISNANLTITSTQGFPRSTFFVSSGKWYTEFTLTSGSFGSVGVSNASADKTQYVGQSDPNAWGYSQNGQKYNNGGTSYGSTYTTNDVIGVALDLDNGKIWWSKNGTFQASGDPAAGTNAAFTNLTGQTVSFCASGVSGGGTSVWAVNFGQRPFTYTPPTGFKALNTFNLPTPTIGASASTQANKYMDATLYTGNGSTQSITNSGSFQPDLVWLKSRSNATDNELVDAVRGATKSLVSNSTAAEATDTNGLTAFNSNGFALGTDANYNGSTRTYVGWQWNAGGSNATNTSGSITSTVRANTSAGFSIATFTTPSGYSTGTVGHGLGVVPSMVIVKNRTAPSGANNWNTYHSSIGNTGALYLNSTSATVTSSSFWNNTTPTSTLFTVGSNLYASTDYVAYCFAEVAGYSKFGSYTGNGSSDGPFVFTGFRPAFILIKCSNAAGGWKIYNTSELNYNPINTSLETNDAAAEATSTSFYSDWLSNGFKLRTTYADFNTNGNTYIYMAFAENPFKYSLAR